MNCLNDISNNLPQYFDQAMAKIERLEELRKKLARNALKWVSKAIRPLLIDELVVALLVTEGSEDACHGNMVEIICAGLVIVDQTSGFCHLAHHTLKRYLIELPDLMDGADLLITK